MAVQLDQAWSEIALIPCRLGHGLNGPRRITPPEIAPVQVPSESPQARSCNMTVWLVPSVIAAMRIKLLR